MTQAIAIGARKHGAKLQQKTEVTKLDLKNDGSWDIGTNQGVINAGLVINAGGFWAKEIGKLSGLDLPLVPMQVGQFSYCFNHGSFKNYFEKMK